MSAIFGRYVSLEALLLALLPLPLAWAACQGLFPLQRVTAALLYGSAAESALGVLQYLGLDPFRLVWQPDLAGSSRLRVYGSLGNPDFVAAWLCATLPLYAAYIPAARRGQVLRAAAFALQLAAIVATGSRVFLLVLPIAAIALLWRGFPGRRARVKLCAAALLALAAAALLWLSPARPLTLTVQGRLYLAGVAATHWREIPVFGYGPGALRLQFVPWQAEWLREHRRETDAEAFAGPVDHVHNDYLEFAVEYGPAGLAAFLLLSAYLMYRAWRSQRSSAAGSRAGVWAALAGLLAIACVDFPFHRPPEWALYWVLLGMLAAGDGTKHESQPAAR